MKGESARLNDEAYLLREESRDRDNWGYDPEALKEVNRELGKVRRRVSKLEITIEAKQVALAAASVDEAKRSAKEKLDAARLILQDLKYAHGTASDLRKPIPVDVRRAVWNRDNGRCVQCESQSQLEFDHIIPVAKGGADSANNIQVLCRECNARKRDLI